MSSSLRVVLLSQISVVSFSLPDTSNEAREQLDAFRYSKFGYDAVLKELP